MGKIKSLYDEKRFVKHKKLFDALAEYDKTGVLTEIKPDEMKCDFEGKCKNKAYAEVYPSLLRFSGKKYKKFKGRGWSYLCRKHYFQEQKKFKNKLPACICGT